MKNRFLAPAILSAGIVAAGCSPSHEAQPPPSFTIEIPSPDATPDLPQPTISSPNPGISSIPTLRPEASTSESPVFFAKVQQVNAELRLAQQLVTKAKSQTGQQVLDFLMAHGVIEDPATNESLPLDGKQKMPDDAVPIYYLSQADLSNPMYEKYADFNHDAQYDPETHVIVLKMSDVSEESRAIDMLHEGFHAKDYSDRHYSYNYNDATVRAGREVDAYTFQGELTAAIVGPTYDAYLQKIGVFLKPNVNEPLADIANIATIYKHTDFGPIGLPAPISQNELYLETDFAGEYETLRLLSTEPDARAKQVAFEQALYSYIPPAVSMPSEVSPPPSGFK